MSEKVVEYESANSSKQFYEDLAQQQDPAAIEIESGRNTAEQVRSVVDTFTEYIGRLPLGPKTKEELTKITEVLKQPQNILIDTHDYASFGPEHDNFSYSDYEGLHNVDLELQLSLSIVDDTARSLADILVQLDVGELLPEQLKQYAIEQLVFHELGHALQLSAGLAARTSSEYPLNYLATQYVSTKSANELRFRSVPPIVSIYIESERFAEGLAHMLTFQRLVDDGLLRDDDAASFFAEAHNDWIQTNSYNQIQGMRKAWNRRKLLPRRDNDGTVHKFEKFVMSAVGKQPSAISVLGYAHFYEPSDVIGAIKSTP